MISKGVFPSLSKGAALRVSCHDTLAEARHHQLPSEALKIGSILTGIQQPNSITKEKGIGGAGSFFSLSQYKASLWLRHPGDTNQGDPPNPPLWLLSELIHSQIPGCASARVKWLNTCELPARCRVSRFTSLRCVQLASKTSEMLFLCQPVSSAAIGKRVRGGRQSRDVLHFASITWLLVPGFATSRRLMNNIDKTVFKAALFPLYHPGVPFFARESQQS